MAFWYTKGQGEAPSFTVGLAFMLLLILFLGFLAHTLAQKNVDVRARVAFDDLLSSYKTCSAYSTNNCYCPPFDLALLPKEYTLRIVDLEGNVLGFELFKHGESRPALSATAPGGKICQLTYPKKTLQKTLPLTRSPPSPRTFSLTPLDMHTLSSLSSLIIYKTPDSLCFVDSAFFEDLVRDQLDCRFTPGEEASQRLGIVHTQQSDERSTITPSSLMNTRNLQFATSLTSALTQRFGKTSLISYALSQDSDPYYREHYERYVWSELSRVDALIQHDFAHSAYLLSTRVSHAIQGRDRIVLTSLPSSEQGKLFAASLAEALQLSANAPSGGKVPPPAGVPLPDFFVVLSNDQEFLDSFFLKYDSYPTFAQRNEIPAVLITFVDADDGHPLLDNRYDTFAERIANGVASYLDMYGPLQVHETNTEPLFQKTI